MSLALHAHQEQKLRNRLQAAKARLEQAKVDVYAATLELTKAGFFVDVEEDILEDLKRKNQKLRKMANNDAVTGILEARGIKAHLLTAAGNASLGRDISVIFLDLDNLKPINDTEGHRAGDKLLRSVAHILKSTAREGKDYVGRIGGDEFMVVCGETEILGAQKLAERIRSRIETETRTTVSIGIAHAFGDEVDAKDLHTRADAAMYKSKQSGRNKITVCTTPGVPDVDA